MLLKKHDDAVFIYDVIPGQIDKVAGYGGIPCHSAPQVAQKSDLIITVVPRSENSMDVYTQILDVVDNTKICVDMSTIDPDVSIEDLSYAGRKRMPLSGRPCGKISGGRHGWGTWVFMWEDREMFTIRLNLCFNIWGRSIIHMGDNG